MADSLIRVLLVDDSPLALEVLRRILSSDPAIQVVGTASNGEEALRLMPAINPTVVCTDYFMPVMDGLELTRRIMQGNPCPVLVISGKLDLTESKNLFSLLEAGALDCIKKPSTMDVANPEAKALIERVRVLSRVFVMRKSPKGLESRGFPGLAKPETQASSPIPEVLANVPEIPCKVLVIGASTGGPVAMKMLLNGLKSDFPVPILYVQHIGVDFMEGFVDWIRVNTRLRVVVPGNREKLESGTLYMPKGNTNLELIGPHEVASKPPLAGQYCPSIDVTMESAANFFGEQGIGILLTGIGVDGAKGLLAMRTKGAMTIAQHRKGCAVFGMPAKAIEWGAAKWVLDLNEMGTWLAHARFVT